MVLCHIWIFGKEAPSAPSKYTLQNQEDSIPQKKACLWCKMFSAYPFRHCNGKCGEQITYDNSFTFFKWNIAHTFQLWISQSLAMHIFLAWPSILDVTWRHWLKPVMSLSANVWMLSSVVYGKGDVQAAVGASPACLSRHAILPIYHTK